MEKKIKFVDAQQMHRLHPDTFEAPDMETLKSIKPGDFIRVCAYQERFWTEVISHEEGLITARVDNNLLTSRLRLNDIVSYRRENVYEAMTREQMNALFRTRQEIAKHLRKGKGL